MWMVLVNVSKHDSLHTKMYFINRTFFPTFTILKYSTGEAIFVLYTTKYSLNKPFKYVKNLHKQFLCS